MPGQSGSLSLGRSGLLAGGAFAPYKCFHRRRNPWHRADFLHSRWRLCRPTDVACPLRVLLPEHVKAKGGGRLRRPEPKKKDMTCWSCLSFWYARRDSNPQPSEPESDALSNCATGAFLNVPDYYSSLFPVCKEKISTFPAVRPCQGGGRGVQ